MSGVQIPVVRPTIKYEYDNLGRKVAEIMPNGLAQGNPSVNRTDYVYDKAGRMIKTMINRDSSLITKSYYDNVGNVTKVVDALSRTVSKQYHPRGWVIAEVDPMNRITYHQYDIIGKEVAVTDPIGVVVKTSDTKASTGDLTVKLYDHALGQMMEYLVKAAYTRKVKYDSLSRQIEAVDLTGAKTFVKYDAVGNQRHIIQSPNGDPASAEARHITYDYTPQYWVESVTNSDGKVTADSLSHTVSYEYYRNGNKKKDIYPSFVATDFTGATSQVINEYLYEYDAMGRLRR